MQTESRTYRKGHMLVLPAAKPRAKAGQRERERSRRNREDKRQLSEPHVPTTEASTPHALPHPSTPHHRPQLPQLPLRAWVEQPPTDASSCGVRTFFGGGTNGRHPAVGVLPLPLSQDPHPHLSLGLAGIAKPVRGALQHFTERKSRLGWGFEDFL